MGHYVMTASQVSEIDINRFKFNLTHEIMDC